ncbi:MAG: M48 family metalloprotease [Gaiellaceae bacterium]
MERRYGRDLGLSLRMVAATAALAVLYLPMLAWLVLFVYGWTTSVAAAAVAALAALGFLTAVPFLSERVTLTAARARLVREGDEPQLQGTVARLCTLADLPVPRLRIAETAVPNAFSAGRSPRDAVVVVTRGLLERLDARELEAVIAHELAHVANRDAFVMTLVGAPAALLRRLVWGLARLPFAARGLAKVPAAFAVLYLAPVLFAGWIAYALMALLLMSLSRYREHAADRGAALITGAPEQLMSGLQRIADTFPLIPREDARATAGLNAFCILPARADGGFEVDPLHLFPTHPPLDERLERLGALARRMGRAVPLGEREARSAALDLPPRRRRENPQAMGSFLLGLLVWILLAGAWVLEPASPGGGIMLVGLVGSAAVLGGIVLGFQGVGRASAGAGFMGYAVVGLTLLLGPWVLAILAVIVFAALGLLGVAPV